MKTGKKNETEEKAVNSDRPFRRLDKEVCTHKTKLRSAENEYVNEKQEKPKHLRDRSYRGVDKEVCTH